jgi:hypothetical protein
LLLARIELSRRIRDALKRMQPVSTTMLEATSRLIGRRSDHCVGHGGCPRIGWSDASTRWRFWRRRLRITGIDGRARCSSIVERRVDGGDMRWVRNW